MATYMDTPTEITPARVRDDDESAIEEIARPNIQVVPQGTLKIQLPPMVMNTAPFRMIWGFGLLAVLDLAMHAGAGAAAASVGAKGNGLPVTTRAVRLGALAGLTKAGMTTFREVIFMTNVNLVFTFLIFLLSSSFGICALLVTEMGNLTLGETPQELVIAALVAAIPLFPETIRDIRPKPDDQGRTNYFRWVWAILLIMSDAVGGYVFARTASGQGMRISNYSAASSAGAAFGAITFLSRALTGCIAMVRFTSATRVSDIFGVYEVVVPEPMYMTREEYAQRQQAVRKFFTGLLAMLPGVGLRLVKFAACCLPCCCPCWRREIRTSMKQGIEYMRQAELEMNTWIGEIGEDMAPFEQMFIGRPVPDDDEETGSSVTDRLLPPRQAHATYAAIR
ncbi:hypothetical protein QBC47DRAFT_395951 [Echria macrotheca]|uniref:Uncharacterized protein n=1 Tax=Echria macrotheca TaxID=438768 RepID=A0AAJ0B0B3_9PEZI|nr:hypothetical protein QBC47DRAFT_395951 [Echria macrotheca]